jgi:hypothetical protein
VSTILAESLKDKKFVDSLNITLIQISQNPEFMKILTELAVALLARPEVVTVTYPSIHGDSCLVIMADLRPSLSC